MSGDYKIQGREARARKKDIDKLTDKLQAGDPVWLIFDNLESVLDGICFQDEHIDLFFACLRNNTHQTRIIITSRVSPSLKNGEDLINVIEEEKQDVKGLKISFAIEFLAKNELGDLSPEKLEELARGVDGHLLALTLLISLVKKYGASDTLDDLTQYKKLRENTIKKTRNLFEKLAGDEKELLERISVYRHAVTRDAIKYMFTDETPLDAVGNLIDKSLLETDRKGNYWLHPLVQEFSYEDLNNKTEVHKLAMDYYLSLSIPNDPAKKEDFQPLIEAHYHACMAEEYDQAFNIILDNNLCEYLDLWGNYTVLIDIYSRLLPKNHFGKEILLKDKESHVVIISNLGNAYNNLGEPRKGIEYYEHSLKISIEIGDRYCECVDLSNLGLTYSDLGEPMKAIEYLEQALIIAKEIGSQHGECAALGSLGNAYYYLGEPGKAIEYFKQALKIAKETEDRFYEGASLGCIGGAHIDMKESNKAIAYSKQALKIAKEIGDRRSEGFCLGNIGEAHIDLGETNEAIEYLDQALRIVREIGDKRGEGNQLRNLGKAYSDLGECNKAIEFLKESLVIGKSIEDPRIISFCEQKLKELEEFNE